MRWGPGSANARSSASAKASAVSGRDRGHSETLREGHEIDLRRGDVEHPQRALTR